MAYIRPTVGKVFQSASIIVMKEEFPHGYILKQNFEDMDELGHEIRVHAPKTDPCDFNLSHVVLLPKYNAEIKLDPKKIKDLLYLRKGLKDGGLWIEQLAERQKKIEDTCDNVDYINEDLEDENIDDYIDNLDRIMEDEPVRRIDQ